MRGLRATRPRLGVAAAGIAIALAVVAHDGHVGSAKADPAHAAAKAPEGGVLRWALLPNAAWDPVTASNGAVGRPLGLVYASLVRLDERGRPTPGLATRWKFSGDGRTLTLSLRKGVTFTDGAPFNAAAVKANLVRGKTAAGSTVAPLLASVDTVQVVGPLAVRLNLAHRDYGLPLVLGGVAGMMVSPKALEHPEDLARSAVGAGPFRLTKFVPGGGASLVRNRGYWDARDIHLDGVELKFLSDPQAIQAGLQSGSIDLADAQGNQVRALQRAGLKVERFPSLSNQTILFNDAIAPFTDHRLIEAINYAIDRNALVRVQAGGLGTPSYQPFPKGYPGWSRQVANLYPYDPRKAKQLLAAAGHRSGLAITLTYIAPFKSLSEQVQAQLGAVGIKVTLEELPITQFAPRIYVKHDVPAAPGIYFGRESPTQTLDVQYGAQGLLNPGRKASPALRAAILKAKSYPQDSPKFAPALQAATALAARQSAVTFLYGIPALYAHTSKVSGLRPFVVAQSQRLDGVRLARKAG